MADSTTDLFVVSEADKGGCLDDSTLSYYKSIALLLDDANEDGDFDPEVAADRALQDLPPALYRICVHRQGSKSLQALIGACSPMQSRTFVQRIQHLVLALAGDRCASHVVQAAIARLTSLLQTQFDGEMRDGFAPVASGVDLLHQISDQFLPHLAVLVTDGSASFVVRALFDSGVPSILKAWTDGVLEADLDRICTSSAGSATLQHLLVVLHSRDRSASLRDLICAVLTRFDQLVQDRAGSHLIECVVRNAPDDVFLDLVQRHYLRHAGALALGLSSNHVVQRVLGSVRDAAQAALCIRALLDQVEGLCKRARAGVVLAMVQCAAQHHCQQKDVFRAVCRAHYVQDPAKDKSLCRRLIDEHGGLGSRLIQGLIQLDGQQQRLVIESFMSAGADWIQGLAVDKAGCHAVESVLKCGTVPTKALRQLCDQLDLGKLALDTYGSYCVQALYERADVQLKERIATVLGQIQQQLLGQRHGPVLLAKLRVQPAYKRARRY